MSRSTVEGLERGVRGTRKTLDKMHRLTALGKLDPTMQKIATWIRLQVPGDRRGATKETLNAVFWWVKRHGVFQRDPFQIEKIEHPIEAMRPVIEARRAGTYRGPGLFVGDCDTLAGVYTATLLGILGFQYAWETAKVDLERPDEFSHVWVAARVDGDWYALDPSTRSATPGWRPPVAPELFARWPEGPIENVGVAGLGDDDEAGPDHEAAYYPSEEYGYSVPKAFGPGGPGFIPVPDAANVELLPPYDTAVPEADLQTDLQYIRAAHSIRPQDRVGSILGQPDGHGPPYYRNGNGRPVTRQPYYKVESQPYPPGSKWNGDLGHDTPRYRKSGPYIQSQEPGTPERQVSVMPAQSMPIVRRREVSTNPGRHLGWRRGHHWGRRRRIVVVGQPRRLPAGLGDDTSGIITSLSDEEQVTKAQMDAQSGGGVPGMITSLPSGSTTTQKTAASAGTSVWDAVSSVFSSAAKVAATPAIQAQLASTVARATNKVAGAKVAGVGVSKSILSSPWFWVAAAATVGAGGYVLLKSRSGRTTRRYRRR